MTDLNSVILSSPVFIVMIVLIILCLVCEKFYKLNNILRIVSLILTLIMIPFLFLMGCSLKEMMIFLLIILLVQVIDLTLSKKDEGGESK